MRIVYIGGGFVGTCSAAAAADSGHVVCVYDIDVEKMRLLGSGDHEAIMSCLFEQGLSDLLIRHRERIAFTSELTVLQESLEDAEAIVMCLPTPEIGETGASDMRFYESAAHDVARLLVQRQSGKQESYVVIVNKSTVPIDMVDHTEQLFSAEGVINFGVVSNPEFLVEGKAIHGSLHPDRIVVGARHERDFAVMRNVYQRAIDSNEVTYLEVTPAEAAAGKLLANFYLFNRLAMCFDVVGRTCERFEGIQFENIRRILTSDPRIGTWGFYDSLFAGGSCFIKDARSLSAQLTAKKTPTVLIDETYLANQRQLQFFIDRAKEEAGFVWQDKTVALLGLSFKRDTNDVRNSPALSIARYAAASLCKELRCYDPAADTMFRRAVPPTLPFTICRDEREALQGADIIIVATDWPQFAALADLLLEPSYTERPLIMDGRRMLQHRYDELRSTGFSIIAVGSPYITPSS